MDILQNEGKGKLDNTDKFDFLKSKEKNSRSIRESSYLITKMSPGVKNENRVNIYANGKFVFSLDVAQVVEFHLKVGKIIPASKLEELRHASDFGKLYQSTLEKTLTRPHSVKEIHDFLLRKRAKRIANNRFIVKNKEQPQEIKDKYKLRTHEQVIYTNEDIDEVISMLIEKGYLDDEKFAEFFVENRNIKKGESAKKLRMELYKKGIASDIIDRVLENTERNDIEEIKKIIAKKSRKYTSEKLIAYLVRQGFDYQLSKDLVLGTD